MMKNSNVLTQADLNDLAKDMGFIKKIAKLLGSRFKETTICWNLEHLLTILEEDWNSLLNFLDSKKIWFTAFIMIV